MLVLNILGGLGVFLYGLKLMSDTLQKISSSKLRTFFDKLTKNKFIGIAIGAIVTMILQSSSATSVLLVGFANAGFIKLTQTISIIFGANIGTTITAQIIAFKASKLALPLIAIGAIALIGSKKEKTKQFGELFFGLGMLFFGLAIMSKYLKPLKDIELFKELFISFGTIPILGIIVGMLITMIVQSSSATTGVIIALATEGAITLPSAFALELGSNIGTTITAQIAAFNTNTTAKRAAWAHTLFNVIGSTYMLILFYIKIDGEPIFLKLIVSLTNAFNSGGDSLVRQIANAHTIFNVFNAIILFPFIGTIAKLTEFIVPEKSIKPKPVTSFIDERLAHSPSIALVQARKELDHLNNKTKEMTILAYQSLSKPSSKIKPTAEDLEILVNQLEDQIASFLVDLDVETLTAEQLIKANTLIHVSDHLERVGDYNIQTIRLAENLVTKEHHLTSKIQSLLKTLNANLLTQHNQLSNLLLENKPSDSHNSALGINNLKIEHELRECHLNQMREKKLSTSEGLALIEIINHFERISAHLSKSSTLLIDVTTHSR